MIDPGILGPWDVDDVNGRLWSECYIVGALQMRPDLIPTVELGSDHFGDTRAEEAWSMLLQAHADHGDVTPDVMLSVLCDASKALLTFALTCQDLVFGFEMLDWHASRVRHGAESRALMSLGRDLAKGGEGDLLSSAPRPVTTETSPTMSLVNLTLPPTLSERDMRPLTASWASNVEKSLHWVVYRGRVSLLWSGGS